MRGACASQNRRDGLAVAEFGRERRCDALRGSVVVPDVTTTLTAHSDRERPAPRWTSRRSTGRHATTSTPTWPRCCAIAPRPRTSPPPRSSAPTASSARYKAGRGSERAWLFGIARNAALDELRRRKRAAALAAEPADVEAALPEDGAEAALRRAAVRAALATLDPRERELIALKFHAGLANAEIAAVLGVSVSNAGTQLHRAMTKLREAVEHA